MFFNTYHTARAFLENLAQAVIIALLVVPAAIGGLVVWLFSWAVEEFSWENFNPIATYRNCKNANRAEFHKWTGKRIK